MIEKVKEGFNKDTGFIKNNDFKIVELTEKSSTVEYIVKNTGLNTIGIVHGGILFGLADTAAGVLACTNGKFPITVNSSINYLKQARKGKLLAKSKAIKEGKTFGVYIVNIYDEDNDLICNASITMYYKNI